MRRKRELRPVFRRVLAMFDTPAEFGRQVGTESRQVVDYWLRIGYIPATWALRVAQATGGKVTALEILNESTREEEKKRLAREERRRQAELAGVQTAQQGAE